MNTSIVTWLFAGALAASLAWNVVQEREAAVPAPRADAGCAEAPDLRDLGLSADQEGALDAWCRGTCASSCGSQREAEQKLALLHGALRDPAASAESLRALAAEVSRLRERSLASCVDSILEVRAVLTKEQLEGLMGCCTLPEPSKP